jgi:threonine synthase
MTKLKTEGKYEVTPEVKEAINNAFYGGYCDDDETKSTIAKLFKDEGYLCDTHTAVAVAVYDKYVSETGDKTPTIIASTASPYKFSKSVLSAIDDSKLNMSEFDMVDKLNSVTGVEVPKPLSSLKDKKSRFSDVVKSEDMPEYVLKTLGVK